MIVRRESEGHESPKSPQSPTYAQIPASLQDIFNSAPYLSQGQKNDLLSIWSSNQSGQENFGKTATKALTGRKPIYTQNSAPKGFSAVPLQQSINDLFNPKPSAAITSIFTNTANQANQAAATAENKQLITPVPVSGFETATQNATQSNKTPTEVTNYENKVAAQNTTTKEDWQNVTQAIGQLNNPQTQQAYLTQTMSSVLTSAMQEMGQNFGYDYEANYKQLQTLVNNNQQFTSQMTQLFQNTLGLQYDIPDEVMNELTKEANNNG